MSLDLQETKSVTETKRDNDEIVLTARDMSTCTVPRRVGYLSSLVETMGEGDRAEKQIPLPNVDRDILDLSIQFMKMHIEKPMPQIEKPLKSVKMKECVDEWYATFIDDLDLETLFKLILGANYMDCKPLFQLCCAKFASLIKDKTPEEIMKTFNIQPEKFTEEEQAAIAAESRWVTPPPPPSTGASAVKAK